MEPLGRGSSSGVNGHAVWLTCMKCKLRLMYCPTWVSTGGASISGPPCSGHREEMHQLRREDGSSRVPHKIHWVGGSRRNNHEEVKRFSPRGRHWGPQQPRRLSRTTARAPPRARSIRHPRRLQQREPRRDIRTCSRPKHQCHQR